MVGEHEFADPARLGEGDRVVDGGMAEDGGQLVLPGQVGRVVEQDGHAFDEPAGVRCRPAGEDMVGQVGDVGAVTADPVAEGPATFVRHLGRGDGERPDAVLPRPQPAGAPATAQPPRPYREARRRHGAAQQGPCGAPALRRQPQVHGGVGTVDARAERQPVHMVPVQVSEQDGAPEGSGAEHAVEVAQACAGVQHERGRIVAVGGDGYAGGVPAVADKRGAGRRRGTPGAENVQPHAPTSVPPSTVRGTWGAGVVIASNAVNTMVASLLIPGGPGFLSVPQDSGLRQRGRA
jgi:hypothetical protein